jgi:hypothetical protein
MTAPRQPSNATPSWTVPKPRADPGMSEEGKRLLAVEVARIRERYAVREVAE